ncbi:MAG: thiamine phosphate synthase [Bacteroidales bacterium]|nr:MAG: thiamine phosphate synthase [Bacteroidales bacterium]
MQLVIISNPQDFNNEHILLTELFNAGLEFLHIRKPGYSIKEIKKYIELIPEKFHKNLIVHKYIDLYTDYNLKGIHFSHDNKHLVDEFDEVNIQKSMSTHSLNELNNLEGFDYVFLSPVFNSISKHGYNSMFTPEEITCFFKENPVDTKVIALGGISAENIEAALLMGFDGAAVMGALWNSYFEKRNIDNTINYFIELNRKCQQFVRTY